MGSEVQRYKKYHTVVRTLSLICGLWPKPDVSRAYQIFTVILASSIIFTGIGTLFFVLNHRANLDLIIKGMAIGVSILSVLLKAVMFSYFRDVLGDIHVTLDAGFQKDFKDPVLQPILLSKIQYFYRPTMSLMYWTMSLATLYILTPVISIIVQQKRNVPKLKLNTPWPTKFPWSYENSIVIYLLQYGSDLCTSVGLFSITCGTDALYGFYIFQMASQFNVLAYRMTNIKSFHDYQRVIKECHERSLMLEYCRTKFQQVFGPIVLWMVTTSAMVLCTNIFQAYQIGTYKAAAVLIHMVTKLIQTLMYGWYGLFLTLESEAFQQSIYNCGWDAYNDKKLWSNILTMSSMYKPLVIKACQMTVISLDTFTAIVNTAISYFFLLCTLDEKN